MRRSLAVVAALVAACAPDPVELAIPDAARSVVIAAPPDVAQVRAIRGSLSGAVAPETTLMALFFAESLDALAVAAGPLDAAHPPFPPSISEHRLDLDSAQWRPLDARPEWLERRLRPTCPPPSLSTVAVAASARGVELYGAIDARSALARIDDRLVRIDVSGVVTPLAGSVMAGVGEAYTDGARLWLLGGRFGASTGRVLEGRLDAPDALVLVEPPGWPPEAGGVRRVDGARDPLGAPDLVVATDGGWLLGYDGAAWRVRYQPDGPVREERARVAWLGPSRAAVAPSPFDGPRLLEVRGSTVSERDLVEPRNTGVPEQVSALARGPEGELWVGGDLGRVYRGAPGARALELFAEVAGEVHAVAAGEATVWAFGPLGLTRIDRGRGQVCAAVATTPYTGTGRLVVLDEALILGGADVLERAALSP